MAKMNFRITELSDFYEEFVGSIELGRVTGVEIDIPGFKQHPELVEQFTKLRSFHKITFENKVKSLFPKRACVSRAELVPIFHDFVKGWVEDELKHNDEVESRPDLY